MEFLHKNCYEQHQFTMDRYGEGKNFPRIRKYFMERNIDPSSKEGIILMKKQFKKFKYNNCLREMMA